MRCGANTTPNIFIRTLVAMHMCCRDLLLHRSVGVNHVLRRNLHCKQQQDKHKHRFVQMCEWLETREVLPSYTLDFLVCVLSIPMQMLIFLADLHISLLFMAVSTIQLYISCGVFDRHTFSTILMLLAPSFLCPFTNRCNELPEWQLQYKGRQEAASRCSCSCRQQQR